MWWDFYWSGELALLPQRETAVPTVASSRAPKLEIFVLGDARVRYAGHDIELGNRKSRALLAYIVLSESNRQTRERIIGVLWSEKDEDKAKASLRQALHEVKDALSKAGYRGLTKDRLGIALAAGTYSVDLLDMLADANRGIVHASLLGERDIMDRLLADLETVDPAFATWLAAKRQIYQQRLVQHLEDVLRSGEKDPTRIGPAATALQNLEVTHEEALRALMVIKFEAGDSSGALAIYRRFYDIVTNEFDSEPSKETQELVARIKLADTAPSQPTALIIPPTRSQAAVSSQPRAAATKLVLSFGVFDTSKVPPESRYLVDGFKKDLASCLIRFREWLVCDHPLAAAAAGHGTALTAEYIIEADAFPAEGSLRLLLMLKEVATGAYLWSERLLLTMANWFEAQEQAVKRITTALNIHVSAERVTALADRPLEDMKAYDLWLLGQATISQWDVKSWRNAEELLRKAVELNPGFAPAYSSLAQLNNAVHIAMPGTFRTTERTMAGLAYAREAVRLDPIDSRSQLCLGWSHALAKQYEQAINAMLLANELNANDPWTMIASANCLAFCGRYTTAQNLAAHALNLPLAPSSLQWSYNVAIRFIAGDYHGCVEAAEAAGSNVNPNVPGWKAAALQHLGRDAEARDEVRNLCEVARRRWVGPDAATDDRIIRWFLHLFPIKEPADWQRLCSGLALAGAPVGTCKHHDW